GPLRGPRSLPTRRASDLLGSSCDAGADLHAVDRDVLGEHGERTADDLNRRLLAAGDRSRRQAGVCAAQRDRLIDAVERLIEREGDRKSTRLNSSHVKISY